MEHSVHEKFYRAGIFVWGIFFVILYAFFIRETAPPSGSRIFNSPDETSNYFFSRHLTEENSIRLEEPLNIEYGPIVYMRSTSIDRNGNIIPGSFVGLIYIYAMIAKFFGTWILPYLTPLLSFFGFFFFYAFVKKIFGARVAIIATFLLMILPAWWYYNSRSMYHNVLFLNLVIASFYYAQKYPEKKSRFSMLLALFLLGLAVFVRASEIFWVLPAFIIFTFFGPAWKEKWLQRIFLVTVIIAIVGVVFIAQHGVFGNFFTAGYVINGGSNQLSSFANVFFPRGINILYMIRVVYWYLLKLFWWYAIFIFIGLYILLKSINSMNQQVRAYCATVIFLSLFIVFTYGNWVIVDSISTAKYSIGISYARYFLPIYVFTLPFAGYGIIAFLRFFRSYRIKSIMSLALIVIFFHLAYSIVRTNGVESLNAVRNAIYGSYAKRDAVSRIIPKRSVLLTERSDKIFFPEYPVIVNLKNETVLDAVRVMIEDGKRVYMYSFAGPEDISLYSSDWLEKYKLGLGEQRKIWDREHLYTVELIHGNNSLHYDGP